MTSMAGPFQGVVVVVLELLLDDLGLLVHLRVEHVVRLSDVYHAHPLVFVDQVLFLEQVSQLDGHLHTLEVLAELVAVQVLQVGVDNKLYLLQSPLVNVLDCGGLELSLFFESVPFVANRVAVLHVFFEFLDVIQRFGEHVLETEHAELLVDVIAQGSSFLFGLAAADHGCYQFLKRLHQETAEVKHQTQDVQGQIDQQ